MNSARTCPVRVPAVRSAATTAFNFGALQFALVPSLQRFGLVTGASIVFAFVSSVVVLPSLLVRWCGYAGVEGELGEGAKPSGSD